MESFLHLGTIANDQQNPDSSGVRHWAILWLLSLAQSFIYEFASHIGGEFLWPGTVTDSMLFYVLAAPWTLFLLFFRHGGCLLYCHVGISVHSVYGMIRLCFFVCTVLFGIIRMLFVKYVLFIIFVYDYEFKSLALYFAVHVCILTDFALWQICLAAVLSFCFRW